MITSLLYDILIALGRMIIQILPDWNFNPTGNEGIAQVINILVAMNDYFPVKTMFLCLAMIFSFELVVIIGNLIIGFVALLRGSGKPEIN